MHEADGCHRIGPLCAMTVMVLFGRCAVTTARSSLRPCSGGPRHADFFAQRLELTCGRATIACRNGYADQLFDIFNERRLFLVTKRDGDAPSTGTRSPANAMHISLRHIRQIEIDDVTDTVHVNTARGDIGGNEYASFALAKCGKHALTLVLRFVAVDGVCREPGPDQATHDLVGAVFGSGDLPSHAAARRSGPQAWRRDRPG
jgi:hypothetical protein